MIKKIILFIVLLLVIVTTFFAWKLTGPATAFSDKRYLLYVKTGSGFDDVMNTLKKDDVLINPGLFLLLAQKLKVPANLKAGKYEIKKDATLLSIARMLRNGKQLPVNLVITKLRTKEDFARFAGRQLECDSLAIISWLNNADSLQTIGVDTNTAVTMVIPNTYTFYWNITASKLMHRLHDEQKKFWTEERLQKASGIELTPREVYTLASIVDEETNKYDEMPLIASVYLNRINKRMLLGADPTVKYAARNFAAKRVTKKMIDESAGSPYNTYRNAGLPPGPICTPSIKTIDAVLNAANTDYLYFCAKADFSGYHAFAATNAEHLKNARAYWKALDSLKIK
ncbi:MAG: endolytic transglycosylase MltG [Chitinophagaceae bacterium]|nr:endolytic transglycosylase MltG [Chitinophagaceae bacterium]